MSSLRRSLVGILLFSAAVASAGCSGSAQDEGSSPGTTEGAASVRLRDLAGAFAVDYALDTGFDELDGRGAIATRVDGDARAFAECLAPRRDIVHGDTLHAWTWSYEHTEYLVLDVEITGRADFADPNMAFIFTRSGKALFQALSSDHKKNVHLYFRTDLPCGS